MEQKQRYSNEVWTKEFDEIGIFNSNDEVKGMESSKGRKAFHILPHIYTANHATFPIQVYAITV